MPVEDHAVHDKVREKEGAVYGCWNKPRPTADSYYMAQDGWDMEYVGPDDIDGRDWFQGAAMFFEVKHAMSTECRFDMSLKDPKCEGCEWRGSGEKYDEMVRRNGK